MSWVYGEYVASLVQEMDAEGRKRVHVTYAHGRAEERFDIVVAADGLGSKIRGMMFGRSPKADLQRSGVFAAYFTIREDLLNGSKVAKWYNTTGGRVVFLRPDPHPGGRTRANLVNVVTDEKLMERFDEAMDGGNEEYMALLEEQFSDAGWLAKEVLQGMRASDDFYASEAAQVRAEQLYEGHVVLLGDAGYGVMGYGTSNAIIAAYVLAGELMQQYGQRNDDSSMGESIEAALKQYQDLILPWARSTQDAVPMSLARYLNPQTQSGIDIRNWIMRFVRWTGLDTVAMRLSSLPAFSGKEFPPREYNWKE